MTYTAQRNVKTRDRVFLKGDKINATEYIALTAEERGNFKQDFEPLSERKTLV